MIRNRPFDAWRFANFTSSELGIPSISAENSDPDGDSLQNLAEYALGLDPRNPTLSTVSTSQADGYLTHSATENSGATDIVWNAEVTADLLSWQAAVIVTNSPTVFVARDTVPATTAPRRFIRLTITRP